MSCSFTPRGRRPFSAYLPPFLNPRLVFFARNSSTLFSIHQFIHLMLRRAVSTNHGAIIACWMLLQSAAALLIPAVLPSAASVPRAAIYMHASGDEVEGALPQPPADTLRSEADAARDEALLFYSEHGDENAYFDDEDVPDDQAMADWREVRRLNRMFAS